MVNIIVGEKVINKSKEIGRIISSDEQYVTVDYETFEVLQAYGKYNSDIDDELYNYIVNLGKRLKFEMLSQQ